MRVFVLLALLWGLGAVAAAARPKAVYDITAIARDASSPDAIPGDVRMLGGKTLPLGMPWAPGQRIVFEDLMPGANWSHPAVYKVLSADGRVLKEVPATLPPEQLERAMPMTDALPARPDVEFKLNDLKGALKVAEPARHFAILINGHADLRHWNDFSFLYRVLTQLYGYLPQQIHVADSVYKDRKPDLDGSGQARIQYASTRQAVRDLIAKVKEEMKPEDHLLVAVNDHGGTKDGESTIILFDGEMKASEFAGLLNGLPPERRLAIFEQCFSGGFVRPAVGGKRVAMSAATNGEYSWGTADLKFDEFIYHVISAFAMQTHDGQPVLSDKNGDGRISAQEAFAYAVGKDQAAESPLFEANTNSGMAPAIGLSF